MTGPGHDPDGERNGCLERGLQATPQQAALRYVLWFPASASPAFLPRRPGRLSHSPHVLSAGAVEVEKPPSRWGFRSRSHLRTHKEICAGCIVSCTTTSTRSRNWSRSTSWRKVALKAARVLAASYLRR